MPNSDLNCDGAVALHLTFLTLCYILAAITAALVVVLWLADKEIRSNRPKRHFFKETGQDLKGDKMCLFLCFAATFGYVMTSLANANAALVALDAVQDYHLVDSHTDVSTTVYVALMNANSPVVIDLDLDFYMNTYLPSKMNQLNLQTVLLIITSMSVVRGHFKQSISAFRLAAVVSLLAAIVQWPPIVGNMETFNYADLWWWSSYDACVKFHSGLPYLNPTHFQSEQFCNDTRWSMAGALITFVAMHLNIFFCARVYLNNSARESLIVDHDHILGAVGAPPGLGDPFTFDYDPDYNGRPPSNQGAQPGHEKPSRPSAGPTVM